MISNRSRPVLLHIRISQGEMLPTRECLPASFTVTLIPFWSIVQGLFVNEGLHGRGSITPEWDVAHRAGVIVTVAGLVLRSGGWSVFGYMLLFSKFIHIFVPDLVSTVRVKRLTYVEKSIQSIYSFTDRCSVFYPTGWMLCSGKPLRRSKIFN